MKNISFFIIIWVSLSFTLKVNAQLPWFWQPDASGPYTENPNHSNWTLRPALSDSFNSGSLDLSKWYIWDECQSGGLPDSGGYGFVGNGWPQSNTATGMDPMVEIQYDSKLGKNVLVLKTDKPSTDPNDYFCLSGFDEKNGGGAIYTIGVIQSACNPTLGIDSNYQYGYYEANMKLPGWANAKSPTGQYGIGFHPAFWLHNQFTYSSCYVSNVTQCLSNEIDIMGPGGDQCAYSNFIGGGVHDYKPPCLDTACLNNNWRTCGKGWCNDTTNTDPTYPVLFANTTSAAPLDTSYHNYAVEFLSDRIIFYFDRQPFAWALNTTWQNCVTSAAQIYHALSTPSTYPMTVILGNGVDYEPGTNPHNLPNIDTTKHALAPTPPDDSWNMKIDYFNYWILNCDNSTNDTITNNTDLTNFINNLAVKKTLTFNGTINYPPDSTRDNITFRATDEIDIKPGFEAPEGSTFNLIITPCNH